jgi:hypothetical protein
LIKTSTYLILYFLTVPISIFAQGNLNSKYFEVEILPIYHIQKTVSENQKIKGDLIPNYQIALSLRKKFTDSNFGLIHSIFATSFGNKFSSTAYLDQEIEFGIGPDRQSKNGFYSIFTSLFYNKDKSPISVYLGLGISLNQVSDYYGTSTWGATSPNTFNSIALDGDYFRTSKFGYFINIGSDFRLFKIKKANSLNIKFGYLIGLKEFNIVEVNLYENHIISDRATISSNGSGIYLGLTYRMLKGRKTMITD